MVIDLLCNIGFLRPLSNDFEEDQEYQIESALFLLEQYILMKKMISKTLWIINKALQIAFRKEI